MYLFICNWKIFYQTSTSAFYRNFLDDELQLYLRYQTLATRGFMWIQNYGMHPHIGTGYRVYEQQLTETVDRVRWKVAWNA